MEVHVVVVNIQLEGLKELVTPIHSISYTRNWGSCVIITPLVHGRTTSKHEFTRLTTTRTWGKPPPSTL